MKTTTAKQINAAEALAKTAPSIKNVAAYSVRIGCRTETGGRQATITIIPVRDGSGYSPAVIKVDTAAWRGAAGEVIAAIQKYSTAWLGSSKMMENPALWSFASEGYAVANIATREFGEYAGRENKFQADSYAAA